jgi:hypothetical protein
MSKGYGPGSSKLPVSTQYGPMARRQEARDNLVRRLNQRFADEHATAIAERQRDVLIRHQGIFIQATLSGPQFTRATVGNRGQAGAWMTVVIGTVVLTFHDAATLRAYAAAWTSSAAQALSLAAWVPQDTPLNDYRKPGVVVTASPRDEIRRRFTDTRTLQIVAGQITWQVRDRAAFAAVQPMWAALDEQADTLFPH